MFFSLKNKKKIKLSFFSSKIYEIAKLFPTLSLWEHLTCIPFSYLITLQRLLSTSNCNWLMVHTNYQFWYITKYIRYEISNSLLEEPIKKLAWKIFSIWPNFLQYINSINLFYITRYIKYISIKWALKQLLCAQWVSRKWNEKFISPYDPIWFIVNANYPQGIFYMKELIQTH